MNADGGTVREDGQLIQQAMAKANGATIHQVTALVGMYRSSLVHHPGVASIFEKGLRDFVRTGEIVNERPRSKGRKKKKALHLPGLGRA